jgi:DivIVA domain-containing protein
LLTANDVRKKQFGTTRLRPGYDPEEVDAFLDEIAAALDRLAAERARLSGTRGGPSPQAPGSLTSADVERKQFSTTRMRPGYEQKDVDDFLDLAAAELDRQIGENLDLRAGGSGFPRNEF